jgi:hypothetical protein
MFIICPYIPLALCKPAGAKIRGVALGKPIEFAAESGNKATGIPIDLIRVAPTVNFPEAQGGCTPKVAAGNKQPAIT